MKSLSDLLWFVLIAVLLFLFHLPDLLKANTETEEDAL